MKYINKLTKHDLIEFFTEAFSSKVKKIKIKEYGSVGFKCIFKNEIGLYEFCFSDYFLSNPRLYSDEIKQFNKCWINYLYTKFGKQYAQDFNNYIESKIKHKTTVYLSSIKHIQQETEKQKECLEEDIEQLKSLYEYEHTCEVKDLLEDKENKLASLRFDSAEYIESIKDEHLKSIFELKSKKIDLEPTKEK